jgi:CRP/FNR family cyclic AMP-dependent transcriptional regulator
MRTPTAVTGAFADAARKGGPPRGSAERWAAALARVPLFSQLSGRQLRHVAKRAVEVRVSEGAMVVRREQPGREFFVILEGRAIARTADGVEHSLGPNDFFGEMAVVDGGPRSAAVIADSDMVLMMLSRREFMRLLEDQPSVAMAVIAELAGRLRQLESGTTPRS